MTDIEPIAVEVAYALPDKQKIISLLVAPGTTAYVAACKSNIEQYFPGLNLEEAVLGLFGQALGTKGLKSAREYTLHGGDRVEIYRPLTADPKEVRRRRAQKAKDKENES